jgi:hypothetical protein
MPIWLVSLIGKILEPIIRPIVEAAIAEIKNAVLQMKINSLTANQNQINAAFNALAEAKTSEEKTNAAQALASVWNARGTN